MTWQYIELKGRLAGSHSPYGSRVESRVPLPTEQSLRRSPSPSERIPSVVITLLERYSKRVVSPVHPSACCHEMIFRTVGPLQMRLLGANISIRKNKSTVSRYCDNSQEAEPFPSML